MPGGLQLVGESLYLRLQVVSRQYDQARLRGDSTSQQPQPRYRRCRCCVRRIPLVVVSGRSRPESWSRRELAK